MYPACQTFLLGGANVTVQGTIADHFGASALSSPQPVNVTAMTTTALLKSLNSMLTAAGASSTSNLNSTITRLSLLLGAEATSTSRSSGVITTLVLDLLAAVTLASDTIDSVFASSIIDTLAALAPNVTASQADDLLQLSATLLNRTDTITQEAGETLLDAASTALAGAYHTG